MEFTPCSICRSPMACRNTGACAETVRLEPAQQQGGAVVRLTVTPEERLAKTVRDYLNGRSDYLSDEDIKLLYNAFCRLTGRTPLP